MKSLPEIVEDIVRIEIIFHLLPEDGNYPNNSLLPLLVLKRVIHIDPQEKNSSVVKDLFESNGWVNSWIDGIYNYHHYHSTAHEVLGILEGNAVVQFGGPAGPAIPLEPGDVVIIPAGVSHKKIESDQNFSCIGAYPEGQQYDINYGTEKERDNAVTNIKHVSFPVADPVYGTDGPLIKNWSTRNLRSYKRS